MSSLKSLVTVSSLISLVFADYNIPYDNSTSSASSTSSHKKHSHTIKPNVTSVYGDYDDPVSYVTEVVKTTVKACTAGETITVSGHPYVLPSPSTITVKVTKTKTVTVPAHRHHHGSQARPTSGVSGTGYKSSGSGSPGFGTASSGKSTGDSANNSPWKNGGHYPDLYLLIGNGKCYPPGLNNPDLDPKNPVKSSASSLVSSAYDYPYTKTPTHPHSPPAKPTSYSYSYSYSDNSTTKYANHTSHSPSGSISSVSIPSISKSVTVSSNSTGIISASPSATACSYWMENVKHQGKSSFNTDSSYVVYRNVKDFGAKGDGVTDDTAAINSAISQGNRCAPGSCASSTTTPAIIYFPAGTYLISTPIIDYYYTQLIGNPNCIPTIKASGSYTARWVIDGDQYQSSGNLGWGSTNVFYRQIANFIIDTTAVDPAVSIAGIHWPTAQATSLQNIAFNLSPAQGTQHEGVFIESGSGGFVADLSFTGGLNGLTVGNQQFTMRNLTFNGQINAINQLWDWGWTYKGLNINGCENGINMSAVSSGALTVGSVVVVDSSFSNTKVGINMGRGANPNPPTGNSLILENVDFSGVTVAVQGPGSTTVLPGNVGHVDAWGQGNQYSASGAHSTFQGSFTPNSRPASLTAGSDFYEQSKPYYPNVPASGFVSVKSSGAKGDGTTDDSNALNLIFTAAATSGKIVYIDAGTYLVSKTVTVPAGVKIFGEAYPVIMSSGSFFTSSSSPKPVVQIGAKGSSGSVEISNLIVSSQGAQSGAILIEYNLASTRGSGLWDVHTRVGGFKGSNLQVAQCLKAPGNSTINPQCIAAFMSMHVTPHASGVYMENNWFWVADHDIEDSSLSQITIYAGRGLLIESADGGNILYGTAVEHHQLYEYNLATTKDIVLGQIQTETAYYQPTPAGPFAVDASWNDPLSNNVGAGWGLNVKSSTGVLIYGAGLYSFFNNYNVTCSNQGVTTKCQSEISNVEGTSQVSIYNLNTVGTDSMLAVSGSSIASWADNQNGFISTIALFRD